MYWEGIDLLRWSPYGQPRAQILWVRGQHRLLTGAPQVLWKNLGFLRWAPLVYSVRVNNSRETLGLSFFQWTESCPVQLKLHKLLASILTNQDCTISIAPLRDVSLFGNLGRNIHYKRCLPVVWWATWGCYLSERLLGCSSNKCLLLFIAF